MKYDPRKIGIIHMAKSRSKNNAEKEEMLLETESKCWVDYHYPGVCPQNGKRLNAKTAIAAHIIAHSKGGDDCVPMCAHCNAEQGVLPLHEYELILKYRYKKLNKNTA